MIEADEGDYTELLPAVPDARAAEIFAADNKTMIDPTREDLLYGYSRPYAPAQNGAHGGYLGQVISPEQFSRLMGPEPLPTPRALVRTYNFIRHVSESPITPALGVMAMAGLSAWAHSQPYHPLWGGLIIAVGGFLIHSGVTAHRRHGDAADQMFTRGAVAAGVGGLFVGTGVVAGLSPWLALAVAIGTGVAYAVRAGIRTMRLERARQFAVGIVAAGNTGPALPYSPSPTPWAGPVSDEEYRLRQAFTKLRAPEVIISPVRRINDNTWSVYADLVDTSTTAEAVAKEAVKIATWTGARRVEALPGARPGQIKLIVHDGEDPLEETFHGQGPAITSILEALRFGRFEDLEAIVQVLAFNHGLIAGASDNGKSAIMNAILIGTLGCTDLQRILIDCKAGAPEFGVYRPVSFCVADNPADGMRVLAGIEAVYRYRGNLMADMGVPEEPGEDGRLVRKWRPEFGPFILNAIDELSELTGSVKGAAQRIQRLNALVRYVGIIRLDATQTPSRNVFGGSTDARLNYQFRVGMRTAEAGAINMILGQGAQGRGWRLDQLGELQGKLMVQSRQHSRPRVGRGDYYDDEAILRYVAQYAPIVEQHPMDEGSAEAFWEGYNAEEPELEGSGGGGGGPRGGKPKQQDTAPAVPFGRPHLVVVPRYPDGEEIAEADVQLWQLLGEYGRDGAVAKDLSTRAKVLDHKHTSEPWVRGRLRFWQAKGYAGSREEGRETVYWRADLRAVQDDEASA
jgi:hypothetical protein